MLTKKFFSNKLFSIPNDNLNKAFFQDSIYNENNKNIKFNINSFNLSLNDEKNKLLKKDRHLLDRKTRYFLEYLTNELKKRGFIIDKENKIDKSIPNINFKIKIEKHVDAFYEQSINYNKSFLFFFSGKATEKEWLFVTIFKQKEKELKEFLFKRPLLFKKALADIDWQIATILKLTNKRNILETRNKRAQVKYGNSNYYENRSLSYLLNVNGEVGMKTGKDAGGLIALDIDWHDEKIKPFKSILEKKVEMLTNYLKVPFYGLSKNRSPHLYFKCLEELSNSTVYYKGKETNYQFIKFADFKGKNGYVVAPISKGRDLVKTKWWSGKISSSQKLFTFKSEKNISKIFAHFGFYFKKNVKVNFHHFSLLKNSLNNDKIDKIIEKNSSENVYNDSIKKNIKIIKIFQLKKESKLNTNNSTISRESGYCQVFYLDDQLKEGRFFIDRKWRRNEINILKNNEKYYDLILSKGYKHQFLKRVLW